MTLGTIPDRFPETDFIRRRENRKHESQGREKRRILFWRTARGG